MPLLALGFYAARVAGGDAGFLQSEPVSFFYLPLNLVMWLAIIAVLLLGIRYYPRLDRGSGVGKYGILLPGAVGIGIVCLVDDESLLFGFPLQVLTLSLLLWRWRRVRNSLWAAVLALAAGIAISLANIYTIPVLRENYFIPAVPVALIIGGICAWPLLTLRVAIRKGVTWRRLMAGVLLGMAVPLAGLIPYGISFEAPSEAYWNILAFVALATLPFAVYVRWNRWVRAVATGRMFQPVQSCLAPGTVEAKEETL